MEIALRPFQARAELLKEQGTSVPMDPATRVRMSWKKAAGKSSKQNTMIKKDELLYARELPNKIPIDDNEDLL